ncbi:MAG: ATP-binding protein [Actinomycetota bacterium]
MKVVRRTRSLKRQILSRTLVVGLVPLLILTSVALVALWQLGAAADRRLDDTRNEITEQAVTDRLEAEALATGRRVALATTDLTTVVSRWTADPQRAATIAESGATATAITDPTLATLVDGRPDVVSVRMTDRSGTVVAVSSSDLVGGELGDDPVWRRGWTDGLAIGPLRYDDAALDHRLPVAMRITDDQGLPTGVLLADLDLGYLRDIADLDASLGLTATIATPDGAVLADTASGHDDAVVGVPTVDPEDRPAGLDLVDPDTGSATTDDALYGFASIVIEDPAATLDEPGTGTDEGAEGEAIDEQGARAAWTIVIGQSRQDAFGSLAGLEDVNDEILTVRRQLTVLMLVVLAFATFVAIAMAAMLTRQVLSPVQQLTERARFVAQTGLPEALDRVLTADGTPATPEDTSLAVERDDELGELARSFNSVQDSALGLAVDQAAQRRNALAMVANLGRRNQSLVNRQLRHIEELERNEDDPDRLASLFGLDHLATRMRRGAQSFLVLAGHRGPSTKLGPVRAEMVVQGALGEVEHYERVSVAQIAPVAVAGHIATDVAHLLAELVENALTCSPPDATVQVVGELGTESYRLAVIDQGIGMTADELAEANTLLADDVDLYRRSTPQLGHVVASKLAARHGLSVWLEANADDYNPSALGIRAIVELPISVVSPAASAPVLAGGATVEAEAGEKPPAPRHRDNERRETAAAPAPDPSPMTADASPRRAGILDEVTGEHPVIGPEVETTSAADAGRGTMPAHEPTTTHGITGGRALKPIAPSAVVPGTGDPLASLLPPASAWRPAVQPGLTPQTEPEPRTAPEADPETPAVAPARGPSTVSWTEPAPLTEAVFGTGPIEPPDDDPFDRTLRLSVVNPSLGPVPTTDALSIARGDAQVEPSADLESAAATVAAESWTEPKPGIQTEPGAQTGTQTEPGTETTIGIETTTAAAATDDDPGTEGGDRPTPEPMADPAPEPGASPSSSSRYRGEISHQSAAQLTPVTRRRSRRNGNPATPASRHPGDRRAVVTTASDDEVRAEAERIRNRWRSFQQGRRTAQSTDPTRLPPAPEGDLR